MNLIDKITKLISSNVGIVSIIAVTSVTSGTAAFKLAQTVPTVPEVVNSQTADTSSTNSANPPASSNTNTTTGSDTSNLCIVMLDGKEYDVTTLRNTHSGGDVFVCGTDMTASYISQHGTDFSRMAQYLYTGGTSNAVFPPAPTPAPTPAPVSNFTFTTATLAQHNKAGDCYVAYNGVVYDVSNHSSWVGCVHHGIAGGTDITSRFPHPTSYLSSLPRVGTISTASSGGTSGSTGTNNGGEVETEQENETEDHEEVEPPEVENDN